MSDSITSKNISKLGFGFMRLPKKDNGAAMPGGEFDIEQICKMVDAYLENGGTYFDTAFVYEGSEEAMRETLVKRHPRGNYYIASKLQLRFIQKPEQMQEQFETTCKRLGVDYLDFYLLHGLDGKASELGESLGAWKYVADLKAQGKVKHMGFSFHGPAKELDEILTKHPEAEFVQLQINYLDWDDDRIDSRGLYETARKHNKPIIVMEPVKGGLLASETSPIAKILGAVDPNSSFASWAMRFAAQLEGVLTVLSGMSTLGQVEDNLKTTKSFTPLSDTELEAVKKAIVEVNAVPRVPCTDCSYCVKGCPEKISIPRFIATYNNYMVYHQKEHSLREYGMWSGWGGKASACIKCGKCEDICPQKIKITETLEKIAELFE